MTKRKVQSIVGIMALQIAKCLLPAPEPVTVKPRRTRGPADPYTRNRFNKWGSIFAELRALGYSAPTSTQIAKHCDISGSAANKELKKLEADCFVKPLGLVPQACGKGRPVMCWTWMARR